MLHRKPMGKYHVQVCTNISCLLVGGVELWEQACHKLGIGHKQVSADGRVSLEEVECMGACSWAPAIQVNYDFYHDVTPEQFDKLLDGLRAGKGRKRSWKKVIAAWWGRLSTCVGNRPPEANTNDALQPTQSARSQKF
jgi:(2Fe-2S) ferredoxin